jgi:hypothetical protein
VSRSEEREEEAWICLNRARNWGSQKQANVGQVKNKAKVHYKLDDGQKYLVKRMPKAKREKVGHCN